MNISDYDKAYAPFLNKALSFTKKDFWKTLYSKVVELATEQPDFVYSESKYQSCLYTQGRDYNQTCDGCLIGQALQRMGFTKDEVRPLDYVGSIEAVSEYFSLKDEETTSIINSLQEIQTRQDKGRTWGRSVYGIYSEESAESGSN